ncbi:MAG: sigma-E processing peptidase SpoIIGA [Ruminococcus sp.]|nr:sigma-E processing peptidase SpoIIGA [Ruminococcus sp.]
MKIYLDVLVITNMMIALVYLWCISRITHDKLTPRQEIMGAVFSGLGSLLAMAHSESFLGALAITLGKLLVISLVIIVSFRPRSFRAFVKRGVLYLLCELLMGGACFALVTLTHSAVLCVKNYVVYFDISLLQLAVCCATVYLVVILSETISRRGGEPIKRYRARFKLGGFELSVPAIADTGNGLCDSFTGAPVVIFRSDELFSRYDLDRPERLGLYGFHPIPYETINGTGLLYVTSKGSVTISGRDCEKIVACCTGVMPRNGGSEYAIFNPEILV